MTYSNTEFVNLVNEYVHSERDRNILIDRFVNGLTFPELSNKYFISERQAKRIVKKADILLLKLR